MATRQYNPFPKKSGLKREPPQNLHPHVPQRETEPEEFIDEYDRMADNDEAKVHPGMKKPNATDAATPPKRNKS
ncbi:hypothetical protein D3C87_2152400 [compost metagenome]